MFTVVVAEFTGSVYQAHLGADFILTVNLSFSLATLNNLILFI